MSRSAHRQSPSLRHARIPRLECLERRELLSGNQVILTDIASSSEASNCSAPQVPVDVGGGLADLADAAQIASPSSAQAVDAVFLSAEAEGDGSSVATNSRPTDVNRDGFVTPLDVLLLLDFMNDNTTRGGLAADVSSSAAAGESSDVHNPSLDVNDDGFVTPVDLLLVINEMNAHASLANNGPAPVALAANPSVIQPEEVRQLLDRAEAASASRDAIFAVVDRGGRILGVRVEPGVDALIQDEPLLVFAIDGAVAKARTAAFFANATAPLTSRTVRFVSQSTITQREVESNPSVPDLDSTVRGPGFVAPIGLGGHFPPAVAHTPPAALFAIEHSNRDSIVHPGLDAVKGTADDIDFRVNDPVLGVRGRFGIPTQYIPAGQELEPPESYGFVSGRAPNAQSRGIATLPGGIPLYKDTDDDGTLDTLVGGIGVFFPGPEGYATYEQGFVAGQGQSENERTNAPKVIEAEWIAFAAAGGSTQAGAAVGALGGVPRVDGFDLPFGRIDMEGIALEIYGPGAGQRGVDALLKKGSQVGRQHPSANRDQVVDPLAVGDAQFFVEGKVVPDGWLVTPHDGVGITAAEVQRMIDQGVAEAELDRAAIRLPLGSRTRMVFSVADTTGEVLGLYRMPDATLFSIDVSVAKSRNAAYYADPTEIQTEDLVDDNRDGVPDLPPGVSFTSRTFRFLAEPRYPSGVDGSTPGAFSSLRDPGIDPSTAENSGAPLPASVYSSDSTSVLAFDAFNPGRNFRDPDDIAHQNGTVFFPGSTPLYKQGVLVGGFGVSGDGVDQDDLVTYSGADGFRTPSTVLRADQVFVRGVRLPFQKFGRNLRG